MQGARLEISDVDRARLCLVVAAIERDLSCLSREATAEDHRSSMDGLADAWAGLVQLLDLDAATLPVIEA